MSDTVETSVAQVGLRDLLFYVFPGVVILVGISALPGAMPTDLKDYTGVGPSVAGLLIAYAFGQCAYPLAYIIRRGMERLQPIDKTAQGFRRAYRAAPTIAPVFFAVEIFRYRTMARFCSVMVFPMIFLSLAIVFSGWKLPATTKNVTGVLGALSVVGFLYRYNRYERRYRQAVLEVPTYDHGCRSLSLDDGTRDKCTRVN